MLAPLARRLRRYVYASLWLLRDGVRGATSRVALIAAGHAVHAFGAACSLGLVLLYVGRAARGSTIGLLGLDLPGDRLSTLVIVGSAALATGLAGAGGLLGAQIAAQRLAMRYHERSVRRILRIASRAWEDRSGVALADVVGATSTMSALALRAMLHAVFPLAYAALVIAYLLWLNPLLTLALAGFSVLYVVPLGMINRAAARHHRDYRTLMPSVVADLRRGLRSIQVVGRPVRDEAIWGDALVGRDDFARAQAALSGRLLAGPKVSALNTVFLVLSVFVILMILGGGGVDRIPWGTLTLYIAGLRIVWASVAALTALVVLITRFFPEYEILVDLLSSVDGAEECPATPPPAGHATSTARIEVPGTGTPERPVEFEFGPGAVVLALAARGHDGDRSGRIAAALLAGDRAGAAPAIVGMDRAGVIPGARLADQVLGRGATPERRARLRHALDALGVRDEIDRLPDALDTVPTHAEVLALSPEAALALGGAGGLLHDGALVVAPVCELGAVDPVFRSRLLDALAGNAVVLTDDADLSILGDALCDLRERIDAVVLLEDGGPVRAGAMDWLERDREVIAERLRPRSSRAVACAPVDEDDLFDIT